MEKLTKEDIQFIDNYLLNSGVIYKDIRVEMIDHVATAVEECMTSQNESFYDAFKAYMVEHKKHLDTQNEESKKEAFKRFWNTYLFKMFTLKGLMLFFIVCVITIFVSKFDKTLSTVDSVKRIINTSLFIVVVFYVIRVRVFMKNKFSALFFSFLTLWLAQFIIGLTIGFFVHSEITGIVTASIFNFLLFHFIMVTTFFTSYYNNKYLLVK